MIKSKKQKLEYLQKIVSTGGNCDYEGPSAIFKYRKFDQYTYAMLENKTIFLSGAYRQDDETECMTKIDAYELYDFYAHNLKPISVELITSLVKPYCSEYNYMQIKQMVYECVLKNGKVRTHFLLDIAPTIQELAPNFDSAILFNLLANIPDKLDEKEVRDRVNALIEIATDAQNNTGICSFAITADNDDLWKRYGDGETGYCVEYDTKDYEYKNRILPVIYDDNRNYRIIMAILGNFIGTFVTSISHGEIKADNTHYLRLFLSKTTKWEQQDEWRIVDPGNPDSDFSAPAIKRIILGKNVSKKNEKEMRDFCERNKIEIILISSD